MEINSIGPFLNYWESVRERTRRVVQRIPPDEIEWSHAPGRFTLGDLVRHLAAIERWMYAETVKGRPSMYAGCRADLADGYDAVINYLDERHAESVEIFRTLSDADLKAKCVTPAGTQITTWKWLRAMVEHEAHHRGQLYLMLGILGVDTPPLYGLTEEEVSAKAVVPHM